MQKLQLYINNERIDLFKDEQVSINQSIQNIKDPAKIFTEFTQTFTIPASKTNNKIFKHYYNFDIVNGYDARNKVTAKIELNYITYKEGFIQLNGTELKNNKIYAYKITFFGETVNLPNLLGDDKLGALTSLSQYNLSYNSATIKSRLQTTVGANIIAPLITSGASGTGNVDEYSRLYYDSQTHNKDNGNLYYVSGTGHYHGVLWSDLKYAIRIIDIINAIPVTYPQIQFTDDFFYDSVVSGPDNELTNLYMWLHRKKGSVAPASQQTFFPTLVDGFGLGQTRTGMINGSGLLILGTDLPNIYNTLDLFTNNTTDVYNVIINLNGSVYRTFSGLTGSTSFSTGQLGALSAGTYTVVIESQAQIVFTSIVWDLSGYDNQAQVGWQETYTSSNFTASATFQFNIIEQIPDMKIIDFLTGIFKMFNLTAFVVSNAQDADYGKIKVQKLDDFYAAGSEYDISEFISTDNSQVNVALPYKEINFTYESTGTLLAQQYEQLQGKVWGAEEFVGNATVGSNFTGPNPTYTVKLPFEHMQFERLVDANNTLSSPANQTTIQYGFYVDDNLDAYISKPLIFYGITQSSSTTSISFLDSTSQHSQLTTYNIPSNSQSLNSATNSKNLNFFLETNEYTLDTTFIDTLFKVNYLNYIQDIFNEKRRLIKMKAWLPLRIIYNLKMNDLVTVNNQKYRINTIKTNLITGESDMELLNEL